MIEAEIDFIGGVNVPLDSLCKLDLAASSRSIVLALVESLAIAGPKGRKAFTIVWSISTLRSAKNAAYGPPTTGAK